MSNIIRKIRRWPTEKRRIFSILLAIFLTIFIIILNSGINLIWKDDAKNNDFMKNNAINSIQESLSGIINEAKPAFDNIFGSSTNKSATGTEEIIDQSNATSSSFSTTSNVVR